MKAILEFNLPEEQSEYQTANQAGALHSILWDLDNELRNNLKHGHKFKTADDALEYVRAFLHAELGDHNVQLY